MTSAETAAAGRGFRGSDRPEPPNLPTIVPRRGVQGHPSNRQVTAVRTRCRVGPIGVLRDHAKVRSGDRRTGALFQTDDATEAAVPSRKRWCWRRAVDLAQAGDKEGFGSPLREPLAIGAWRSRIGSCEDADLAADAVQTTLVTAWRASCRRSATVSAEPWLYRMLVRTCYAESKRHRRTSRSLLKFHPETTDDRRDAILTVDDRDQLERGFQRLSPSSVPSSSSTTTSVCRLPTSPISWDPGRHGEIPAALRNRGASRCSGSR